MRELLNTVNLHIFCTLCAQRKQNSGYALAITCMHPLVPWIECTCPLLLSDSMCRNELGSQQEHS